MSDKAPPILWLCFAVAYVAFRYWKCRIEKPHMVAAAVISQVLCAVLLDIFGFFDPLK